MIIQPVIEHQFVPKLNVLLDIDAPENTRFRNQDFYKDTGLKVITSDSSNTS